LPPACGGRPQVSAGKDGRWLASAGRNLRLDWHRFCGWTVWLRTKRPV